MPPSVLIGEREVAAVENSRVQLACAADGVPQPSLHWEKDGSPFSDSAEEPVILPSGELLITSVQVG